LAKEIYAEALAHIDELCAPYATVIDINRAKLPTAAEVNGWTSDQFVRALRHNQADPLVQCQPTPVDPRRIQGRSEDGNPLLDNCSRNAKPPSRAT
jgi:hypothetical protein